MLVERKEWIHVFRIELKLYIFVLNAYILARINIFAALPNPYGCTVKENFEYFNNVFFFHI